MKISRSLVGVCLATAICCGCQQRSSDAPLAGSFQLVVDDMVKDDSFRVASVKISSRQPATLSIDMGSSHAAGELLISPADKLREGRAFFLASRVSEPRGTNALIQASLDVKVEGGDGGLLIHGGFASGNTEVYPVSQETKLQGFLNMSAKSGVYPLDTPIEIGRIDGKAVTLTVGKPTR